METAILLLAAGASRRMGSPKQLLPMVQGTLLDHVLGVCQEARLGPVWVVLGAYADQILPGLPKGTYHVLVHEAWAEGMGSSLAAGIRAISPLPEIREVMIVLADQVKLSSDALCQLLDAYRASGKSMAVSVFEDGSGPPSVFGRRWFEELTQLSGDEGAKPLVKAHPTALLRVAIPEAAVDVDTWEDWERRGDRGLEV